MKTEDWFYVFIVCLGLAPMIVRTIIDELEIKRAKGPNPK